MDQKLQNLLYSLPTRTAWIIAGSCAAFWLLCLTGVLTPPISAPPNITLFWFYTMLMLVLASGLAVIGAAAVLVLVLGTLGAAYSPLFAVQTITVEGTGRLDAGAVEEALSGQLGTPMPLVDDSEVKAVLVGFPLVETYSLEARPPHELVVRIVERTPIGVLSSPAGFTLVDAAGVGLSTTSTPPVGEPLIEVTGGVESDAFEAVGHVVRSLPAGIRPQVTQVAATTPNDVTLTLGATGTEIVWGGADDSAMKALALETIMRSRPPETVAAYDVSSPDAIVLR